MEWFLDLFNPLCCIALDHLVYIPNGTVFGSAFIVNMRTWLRHIFIKPTINVLKIYFLKEVSVLQTTNGYSVWRKHKFTIVKKCVCLTVCMRMCPKSFSTVAVKQKWLRAKWCFFSPFFACRVGGVERSTAHLLLQDQGIKGCPAHLCRRPGELSPHPDLPLVLPASGRGGDYSSLCWRVRVMADVYVDDIRISHYKNAWIWGCWFIWCVFVPLDVCVSLVWLMCSWVWFQHAGGGSKAWLCAFCAWKLNGIFNIWDFRWYSCSNPE